MEGTDGSVGATSVLVAAFPAIRHAAQRSTSVATPRPAAPLTAAIP